MRHPCVWKGSVNQRECWRSRAAGTKSVIVQGGAPRMETPQNFMQIKSMEVNISSVDERVYVREYVTICMYLR